MTDDTDVLGEVDGVHLSQCTCARDGFQDTHRHRHLHVAFYSASSMLLNQHRESGDEHRVELACYPLSKARIVGSYHAQLLVLHPLLEGNDILRHVPYLLYGAATLNLEGV